MLSILVEFFDGLQDAKNDFLSFEIRPFGDFNLPSRNRLSNGKSRKGGDPSY